MKAWPLPKSLGELRELPVRRKGEWKGGGFGGRVQQAGVLLGMFGPAVLSIVLGVLVSPWWFWLVVLEPLTYRTAKRFMTQFHTVMGGAVWLTSDTTPEDAERVAARIMEHEGVHDWHQRHVRGYKFKYIGLGLPVWRRQTEGAAYALDVMRGRRSLQKAAESFSDPIYWMFLSEERAEELLQGWMDRWRAECEEPEEGWKA